MSLWFLVALPLVVGGALLVGGRRADRFAAVTATATAAATVVLAVLTAVQRPAVSATYLDGIAFALRVDGLSAVMVVVVAVVLLAVLVFAAGEFDDREARARFFGLMLLFSGAMLVTVTATTLLALLMAWEVMGAASYALIGYWWREPRRATSGTIAFLTTRGGDLGLYLAAGAALAGGLGGLELAGLSGLPDGWRDVVSASLVVAAFGKSAQLPFSFWLSRAMDGPSPVSALLHSATMVAAGAYLLVRLEPLLAATPWAATVVAWGGALTALLLGAVAVAQTDLKQLLAASTCAQVGFMVLAAGAGGAAAGAGHLVTHAVTKSLLFLCAGAWLTAIGSKQLPVLRGAARRFPVVGVAFTVGAAALAGVPPLSLWVTKDHVLANALHDSAPLYLVGLAAAVLSAAYATRAVVLVWSPSIPDAVPEEQGTGTVNLWQRVPLPVLAVGAVALGVVVVPSVWGGFADVVLDGSDVAPAWWELVLSGALALLAAGTTAVVTRRRGDLRVGEGLQAWFGLERLARALVYRPMLAGADRLARFDDRAVAGSVQATAAVGAAFARVVDARAEWSVDRAVRAVADGFRALGRLARRPQTGQLHHYYAQAVVALAALAVLLLLIGRR
ncbi:NADH-quinone oxidoreductase subunit L [Actinophytocola sp. NPDC049390]|uniref:NADH-quinone oxidoreductase subunit L n=1 Tax=Actinophytocola sp. NPDC049390 TaxID=3363894 RepID=UPI00379B18B2